MATPKLFQALNNISDDEWISYRKYLLMHTRKESNNYLCCQVIYEQRKKLDQPKFDVHINHKYFKEIKPKSFQNILSRLFGWFEEWLAIETFKKERYASELQLVKAYNERGLFKLADQIADKLEKKIKERKDLDVNMNKALSQLYHSQYYSSNPIKRKKGSTLYKECLTHFIYTTKEFTTGYLTEIENQSQSRNIKHNKLKESLSKILELDYLSELDEILRIAYKLTCSGDTDSYLKLESILKSDVIDPSSDLFLILSIYLRRASGVLIQTKQIDAEEVATAYQLSFLATAKNRNQKFLAMNLFNGVSTLGTMMNFEETESFIEKWIDKVHTKYRESTFKYCQVLNFFRHDIYEPIPELVQGLSFDFPIQKTISQLILIIAHYKLGEEELTLNLIHNLKKQIKRNVQLIPSINYHKISNLLTIIDLLVKSRYDAKIKINLEDYDGIFYRSWVQKQIKFTKNRS